MPLKRTANGTEKTAIREDRASENGRDDKGRFTVGNSGGPGRPRGEREYLNAMIDKATITRWNKIVDKLLTLAEAGDVQAFNALKGYLIGLPVQRFEVATLSLLAQLDDALKVHGVTIQEALSVMLRQLAEQTEDEQNEP